MRDEIVPALDAYIAAWRERLRTQSFRYGTSDCARFTAGWVQQVRGYDPLGGVAEWHDIRSACRRLAQEGRRSLVDAVSARLPSVAPPLAQIGDIVASRTGNWHALGICTGRHGIFLNTSGVVACAMQRCDAAWSLF